MYRTASATAIGLALSLASTTSVADHGHVVSYQHPTHHYYVPPPLAREVHVYHHGYPTGHAPVQYAPAPVQYAPAPVQYAPAPAPVQYAPAPAPVQYAPAPAPVQYAPAQVQYAPTRRYQPADAPPSAKRGYNVSGPGIVGMLIGGAAGGYGGSYVGSGRGNLAATAGGAVLGALFGGEVGKAVGHARRSGGLY